MKNIELQHAVKNNLADFGLGSSIFWFYFYFSGKLVMLKLKKLLVHYMLISLNRIHTNY